MTPTEQDKLREQIEAIFKNPHCASCHEDWDYDSSYRTDSCCTRFMTDSISKVVELITADRKRVALEARLDERQMLNFHRAYGKDYQETLETLEETNDERIAELKAQQEKTDDQPE